MYEKKLGAWDAYKLFWKNAFNYKGRARRAEYWWPNLFNYIISMVLQVLVYIVGGAAMLASGGSGSEEKAFIPMLIVYLLMLLFSVATFFPSIAVQVRRLHDRGFSGWIYLGIIIGTCVILFITFLAVIVTSGDGSDFTSTQALIIFVGFLLVLIMNLWVFIQSVCDSKPGPNKWGPNPKEMSLEEKKAYEASFYNY